MLLPAAFSSIAYAQPVGQPSHNQPFDHVINNGGESRISVVTGLPVVAGVEYAYDVSDRLTVGIFGGFTSFEEAVGVRIRTVLHQRHSSFRIYYCTPIIFYPQRRRINPDPWFITRPNINFEWLAPTKLRYKFGGSIIAMASKHDLFGDASKSKHAPELWSAVHGGISIPIGQNISFQTELSLITKEFQTVDTFLGGPPILLIIRISQTF